MEKNKREWLRFLVWLRNGSAFSVTWFLILLLVFANGYGMEAIPVSLLTKLVILSFGGVLMFSLIFTGVLLKKWRFVTRLTCFMLLLAAYEVVGFYWLGIFARGGNAVQWLSFVGIVLVLYLICIVIYHFYSKRRGEIYTEALQKYQYKRSMENERE